MTNFTVEYGENIRVLVENGKTNREIASIIGIGKSTVQAIINKQGYVKNKWNLSKVQEEVLYASVIADGCLFKSTPGSNARMNLAHSLKQKEYFMYKYEILKPIIRSEPKERTWFDKRTNKYYSEIRFQSRVHEKFTELWLDVYRDGKRVITKEALADKGELTLAIKFFDDGFKGANSHYIAMSSYDDESVQNFRDWIKEKFDIKTNVHKDRTLYFPTSENPKLCSILMKYATNDMYYKI